MTLERRKPVSMENRAIAAKCSGRVPISRSARANAPKWRGQCSPRNDHKRPIEIEAIEREAVR